MGQAGPFPTIVGAQIVRPDPNVLPGDVRTGGSYRLVMGHPSSDRPMAFFGRYVEVTPPSRIVWTNDEAGEEGAVTTVTFEDRGGATRVVVRELYPSKHALDEALASGSTTGWGE